MRDERRLAVAKELGAHHTVFVDQENLGDAVKRITNGRMADIVIDSSGGGPDIVNPALAMLRKRGVLVMPTRKGAVDGFDLNQMVDKQIVVRGTRGHSYGAVELALKTMGAKTFPLEKMSSHVVGLKEIDHALKMVGGESNERSIHITVDPWKQ
jgi:threonine dehydrogenase-like Zn-dependent dehydrogenase